MTPDHARRVEQVDPSATLAIKRKSDEVENDGHDVVDLSIGEPDFDTPQTIKAAGIEAIQRGDTGYTAPNGIAPLREAISTKLNDYGIPFYSPDDIIVTPGGKQGIFEVIHTLIDDGDEVVVFTPAWVSYEPMTKMAGGTVRNISTAEFDFELGPAIPELRQTVSEDTSLIVVNSPGNPHGAIYSEEALEAVATIANEHDVPVLSDEIYKEITYEGQEAPSMGAVTSIDPSNLITINGFSKAYAMTGWRLGYLAAPPRIVDDAGTIHTHSVTCAANFVQQAGIQALENGQDAVDEMVASFRNRRDTLIDLFADHGKTVPVPDGSFYMMLPVDADDVSWANRAIQQAHVATVPGSSFGTSGYVRLSYANSMDRLELAVERLASADLL
jgi:aspartate aminotransferase